MPQVRVGDPREEGVLVGPLIDEAAFEAMQRALDQARAEGGKVTGGERVQVAGDGVYVRPALVEMPAQTAVVLRETFAPILYVMSYGDLGEAIALQQRRAAGALLVDLHQRHARGRAVRLRSPAPTAASPTSTSAPPAPRSAAPSAARRRPAAAAKPAPTAGAPTCAAPPTR